MTNDESRRQTATRRDAKSVAAATTKPQGNSADKLDGSQSAKTAGVKAERNRWYENNECFVCGKKGQKPDVYDVYGQSHGQDYDVEECVGTKL